MACEIATWQQRLLRSQPEGSELAQAGPASGTERYPHRRGRLRVYLGAVAGAGKTYAMLNEGHRRESRGTDVVVGYVETHKRPQTETQLGDLEIIPRKKVTYRGVTLEEMDTEAIIARHPRVVLIDELAHTNVPGSKHAKRYQDVQEILEAGIDVVTTLNIQHLESLNDLVASITGVRVRETLPDWILDQAEEVELIDISPYALRQRMKHGNIYPPERIETALSNFFREGNLTALRELALRRTAEKTEAQLEQYMTEHGIGKLWASSERVMVGFDARPHTRQVIRDAWRLAHSMHADFHRGLHPAGRLSGLDEQTHQAAQVWPGCEQGTCRGAATDRRPRLTRRGPGSRGDPREQPRYRQDAGRTRPPTPGDAASAGPASAQPLGRAATRLYHQSPAALECRDGYSSRPAQ